MLENKLCLEYIGGFTACFILGWYLHKYDIKKPRNIYILGIIGAAFTIFGTYILSITTGKAVQMYGNFTINILLQSIMAFVFIKSKFINKVNKENKAINSISKYSLGIYAIHPLIINAVQGKLIGMGITKAILNIPIAFLATVIISWLITYIFSKILILKKVV